MPIDQETCGVHDTALAYKKQGVHTKNMHIDQLTWPTSLNNSRTLEYLKKTTSDSYKSLGLHENLFRVDSARG